ncbi:hypothetical protein R3W88_000934 [Solanum pinnatisectum]|uniref:Uncharacterized protein n=1 Tax=Solanum pinnatisectum TaxID=50273 RepID=A0AAV9MIX2_9SOLN|nr:hypothetical protein R3W88_000934 [Solanum pinnatisectum]
MGFLRLSWPIVPFNSLGTSYILPLPSYILNYFQKAILIRIRDGMVNILCSCAKMILINSESHLNHLQSNLSDIETIEITNKHTCRVFSLTPFIKLRVKHRRKWRNPPRTCNKVFMSSRPEIERFLYGIHHQVCEISLVDSFHPLRP